MAKGDYGVGELLAMSQAAATQPANTLAIAENVLRIAPQLGPADLQTCIAFRIDPFAFLAAKLGSAEAVAAERKARIAREDWLAQDARRHTAWEA